jgi:3-hydroxyisobutyrate dehydrogenase-like beta-hydroxyacid dehydrogenase
MGIYRISQFHCVEESSLGGRPFVVQCEVVVTRDFKSERHIRIEQKDLALRRTAS